MQKFLRVLLFSLFGTAAFWLPASAQPAGIVLYMESGGEVYLLLADHADPSARGWAAFGGGHEEGETAAQTAARETEEETRGFFPREALSIRLEGLTPVVYGSFHLYFVEIPFVPAQRVAGNIPEHETRYYRERWPYAWIPYAEVRQHLIGEELETPCLIDERFLPEGAERNWFWSVWIQNMRLAFRENAIPWENAKD